MFDIDSKRSIIEHMNDDHTDALLAYVHAFADRRDAASARLVDIDAHGMDIEYQAAEDNGLARIPFPEALASVSQVRGVLVSMVNQARTELDG